MIFLKKIIFTIVFFAIASCADTNNSKSITIGTNPAGTFYYVVGTGLSKLFSEKLDKRAIANLHPVQLFMFLSLIVVRCRWGLVLALKLVVTIKEKWTFKNNQI